MLTASVVDLSVNPEWGYVEIRLDNGASLSPSDLSAVQDMVGGVTDPSRGDAQAMAGVFLLAAWLARDPTGSDPGAMIGARVTIDFSQGSAVVIEAP